MDKLTELFIKLVQIPSPSGQELEVANFIKDHLTRNKIKVKFDGTGKINNSNSGNLIAELTGDKSLPSLLFVAHMDTVETGQLQIRPQIKNNIIKSEGKTILGADDKAAVACLMESLKEIKTWKKHPIVFVAFTCREEQGVMGASLLKIREKIDYAFNIDGPNVLGDFVNQTLGEMPFEIKIIGKAAHAAVEPEKGINAIKAAAIFIGELNIGKDKEGSVLNIGKIAGGKANNIVPDEVVLQGQARAFRQEDLDNILIEVEKKLLKTCDLTGCTFEFNKHINEFTPVAFTSLNHPITQIAKRATNSLGLPFSLGKGSYSADSNFLSSKYPTLTICRGSKMPHSFDETISIENLQKLKSLILQIVKEVSE